MTTTRYLGLVSKLILTILARNVAERRSDGITRTASVSVRTETTSTSTTTEFTATISARSSAADAQQFSENELSSMFRALLTELPEVTSALPRHSTRSQASVSSSSATTTSRPIPQRPHSRYSASLPSHAPRAPHTSRHSRSAHGVADVNDVNAADSTHVPPPRNSRPKKWYVITRGIRTGVFTDW